MGASIGEQSSESTSWRTAIPASVVGWVRGGLLLAIVVSAAVVIGASGWQRVAEAFDDWTQQAGPWSFLVFVGIFVVLSVFSLPVWQMPFLAGAIFGTFEGAALSSSGCCAGSAVSFLIGRSLGRTRFRNWLERSARLRALEHGVTSNSWKVVAAIRLSHLLPFGLQNYMFSLTGIRFRTFLLTTFLITLPGLTLQTYLGHLGYQSVSGWESASDRGWTYWATRVGGLAALVVAVGYIVYLVRNVYVKNVRRELERMTFRECKSQPTLSRWDILLAVAAGLMISIAVWSVVDRDAIRRLTRLPAPPAVSGFQSELP